ncbi:MAG: hypothetical protein A3B10_02660 [Candidatus Doudnabacteria bacterium RIFCSPLOWO2_01_FULL_44_21]|uniref:Uncharacterized protein n=1 Tax=Candidatus Doudnabacteria bacterium RIFCSPLOWO2_01_FULL_44_21 TaxID=1817841 RepID=A0A1F5Q2W7_9BACT|nr:MAG: hypothetical protein A3B95_02930 [Candidatus Doudnabacteria bacterium RIFCSPHIGHO2_02_FULL_43_13b]OGE96190.1 MAG: hypothetical protein A3B10_02660 [Candidatus Doudnabacteria bacterium RIFCSPLOWO2_01_FULL_44_21]
MKLKFNWNKLNWKSGLLLIAGLLLVALAINEVSSYFIRQNLKKDFDVAAAKITNVSELGQLVEAYAPKFAQTQSVADFFNRSRVELNLSAAYDGDSGDDQQPRDKFTEPQLDCALLIQSIMELEERIGDKKLALEYYSRVSPGYVDPDSGWSIESKIRDVEATLAAWESDYSNMLKAYATKCIGIVI